MAKKAAGKRGRPPGKSGQAREKSLFIRLSDDEAAAIHEAAKVEMMPAATWVRRLVIREARKIAGGGKQ